MKRQRMEEELAGCNTVAAVITRTQLARQRTNSAMEHTTQTRTDMHDAYTFDNLSGSDFSRKIQALRYSSFSLQCAQENSARETAARGLALRGVRLNWAQKDSVKLLLMTLWTWGKKSALAGQAKIL